MSLGFFFICNTKQAFSFSLPEFFCYILYIKCSERIGHAIHKSALAEKYIVAIFVGGFWELELRKKMMSLKPLVICSMEEGRGLYQRSA